MSSPQRICVVTGTRAEYGLLRPLMARLQAEAAFELQIVATAMHLSDQFGNTYREIEADGFVIDRKVDMLLSGDRPSTVAKSMGIGLIGLTDAFDSLAPDRVLLLGDRFEALAAAEAAMLLNIPIIHLHGGESSFGAVDEAMRHAITKMAHLHFVATETYRKRVIQLGEDPGRVFNVGALGVENIDNLELLSLDALAEAIDFPLEQGSILMTYHPETLGDMSPGDAVKELLDALKRFPDRQIIITYPNADAHSGEIIKALEQFAAASRDRVYLTPTLGYLRYLSAMKHAAAVVGNSSSGIIEAPSFGVPTVNIGNRQQGRVSATSVIHCEQDKEAIVAALTQALSDAFATSARRCDNPYDGGATSAHIVAKLRGFEAARLGAKTFFDVPFDIGGDE